MVVKHTPHTPTLHSVRLAYNYRMVSMGIPYEEADAQFRQFAELYIHRDEVYREFYAQREVEEFYD